MVAVTPGEPCVECGDATGHAPWVAEPTEVERLRAVETAHVRLVAAVRENAHNGNAVSWRAVVELVDATVESPLLARARPVSSTPPTLAAITSHARAHGWTDDRGRRWGCWWVVDEEGPRLRSLRQEGAHVAMEGVPGIHAPGALAWVGTTWRAVDAAGLACGCGTGEDTRETTEGGR